MSAVPLPEPELAIPWDFGTEPQRRPLAAPAAEPAPLRAEPPPAPVVAPHIPADTREKLVLGPDMPQPVVEQYRQLAATLHSLQRDDAIKTVMVTSAVPHEGKTLVAANLALVLATSFRRRVLLIDGDLRRPSLHSVLGVPNVGGLADCLDGERGRAPAPIQVAPRVSLLVAGTPQTDPMRIVTGAGMQKLLAESAGAYDWVVLDSPPVAILPDGHLLAAMVDRALLVIQAARTPYDAIQKAIDTIGRERILGAVLNRAEDIHVTPYGGGYGYYSYAPREAGE